MYWRVFSKNFLADKARQRPGHGLGIILLMLLLAWLAVPRVVAQPKYGQTKHPWMYFDNGQRDAIQAKLQLQRYADVFKNLPGDSPLRYFITNDITIARKIKANFFTKLMQARTSMDTGKPYNYSALQWGRRMQEWTTAIEPVIDTEAFDDNERAALRQTLDDVAYKLRDPAYVELEPNNRALDELMGVAFAGVFLFPENPNAADHYQYVKSTLAKFLDSYVGARDGAWPETPRYVSVVARCLSLFAWVEHRYDPTAANLLIDDTRFHSVLQGLALVVTPPDALNNNRVEVPGIGDAAWTSDDLAVLCWGAMALRQRKPELSALLYRTWADAGSKFFWPSQSLPYVNVEDVPALLMTRTSLVQPDIGYFISRNHVGTPAESYLIAHVPYKNYFHRHADAGSFSLYAFNVPLMLDAGVTDYSDPLLNSWYKKSQAHNMVVFRNANGDFVNGLDRHAKVMDHSLSDLADFMKVDVTTPLSTRYHRSIVSVKSPGNFFAVFDYVEAAGACANNLHFFSTSTDIDVHDSVTRLVAHAYQDVDVETKLLLPASGFTINVDKGPMDEVPATWPRNLADANASVYQQWITVNTPQATHFLTVIFPHARDAAGLSINPVNAGNAACSAFAVSTPEKTGFVLIANTTTAKQTVTLTTANDHIDLRTGTTYQPVGGVLSLEVDGSSIAMLRTIETPVITNTASSNHADAAEPLFDVYVDATTRLLHLSVHQPDKRYRFAIVANNGTVVWQHNHHGTEPFFEVETASWADGLYIVMADDGMNRHARRILLKH